MAKGKTAYILLTVGTPLMWPMILVYSGNRGYLTSFRQKIKNSSYALELLKASQLHKSLGIIKIPGHSIANMEEIRINHLIDTTAKLAALKQSEPLMEVPVLQAKATGDLEDNITLGDHFVSYTDI